MPTTASKFQGVQTKPQGISIVGKLGFSNHPMLEHFKFLKAHTKVVAEDVIPSPAVLHFRLPKTASPRASIADIDSDLRRSRQDLPARR